MSEHKRYTADEMCDAADWFKREDQHAIAPEIEQMLRYAAEMVERCDKKRKELDEEWFYEGADELTMPMEDCYKIIDYILRGDAGKENEDNGK